MVFVQRFEILPHTADVAVAIYGESLAGLFANAGSALFELMFDMEAASGGEPIRIEAAADGIEELLVGWLSELLFVSEVRGIALSGFEVTVNEGDSVVGSAKSTPTAGLVLTGAPIKAVTYHDLAVRRVDGVWRATVVFDV